ncbi:MAG: hypothetical protein ACMUIS_03765 [bacterium]
MQKTDFSIKIPMIEIVGALLVIVFLWIDELLDLPHLLFGSTPTPVNVTESILETVIIAFLVTILVVVTLRLLRKIKYLEGLLHMCVFCKRIRSNGDWLAIEQFIGDHSHAEFSHGLCPDCVEKHYGEFLGPQKVKSIIDHMNNSRESEAI